MHLHCVAEIREYSVETEPSEIDNSDIITRLLDNAAFVCLHVVGRFSKDFSEEYVLRSRGFQLQVKWMTTVLYEELVICAFNR